MPDTARVTITVQGARSAADQAIEHLRKLVDVRWATVIPVTGSGDTMLLREFALMRVSCGAQNRREVMALAERFGARVVDIADSTLTLEVSGSSDTIEQTHEDRSGSDIACTSSLRAGESSRRQGRRRYRQ
jgi:acetolactate synthase-1/3 small subunit